MYRQYDGYPSCHGLELAEFLSKFRAITNGMGADTTNTANGMGCLAAQIVQHFKENSVVGGIYLHRGGTRDVGEEYIYTVELVDNKLQVTCESTYSSDKNPLFSGNVEDFLSFCKTKEEY